MTHTPGPWWVDEDGEYLCICEGEVNSHGEREEIAQLFTNRPSLQAFQPANARLIAAAPEMLAALNEAYDALNIAPRFKVRDTDSYAVAFKIGELLNKINVVEGRDE